MRALLPFTKYHGLGNDFVLIDARELVFDPALGPLLADWAAAVKELAPRICDRHYGVGADGVILAMPIYGDKDTELFEPQLKAGRGKKSSGEFPVRHAGAVENQGAAFLATQYGQAVAKLMAGYPQWDSCDLGWVYTNSDGSNAVMCGNGLRCLALWARFRGGVEDGKFKIATAKGAIDVQIESDKRICVDVGEPILKADKIPVAARVSEEAAVKLDLDIQGKRVPIVAVGMGNPHAVIFDQNVWSGWPRALQSQDASAERLKEPDLLDGVAKEELTRLAQTVQADSAFPEGVNVEIVQLVTRNLARCYVYERGCGFTLACASGAAAVVVAGVLSDVLDRETSVQLPGGVLEINFCQDDNRVRITGPAAEIFSGVFKLEHFEGLELCSDSKAEANCK